MDEEGVDALFARVFATPDGRALLLHLARRNAEQLELAEVVERLARSRARWETAAQAADAARR